MRAGCSCCARAAIMSVVQSVTEISVCSREIELAGCLEWPKAQRYCCSRRWGRAKMAATPSNVADNCMWDCC